MGQCLGRAQQARILDKLQFGGRGTIATDDRHDLVRGWNDCTSVVKESNLNKAFRSEVKLQLPICQLNHTSAIGAALLFIRGSIRGSTVLATMMAVIVTVRPVMMPRAGMGERCAEQ